MNMWCLLCSNKVIILHKKMSNASFDAVCEVQILSSFSSKFDWLLEKKNNLISLLLLFCEKRGWRSKQKINSTNSFTGLQLFDWLVFSFQFPCVINTSVKNLNFLLTTQFLGCETEPKLVKHMVLKLYILLLSINNYYDYDITGLIQFVP